MLDNDYTREEQFHVSDKEIAEKNPEEINVLALLSYLGILVLIPLLVAKGDKFAQFHARQGLILIIFIAAAMFMGVVPVIAWTLGLGCLILAFIGLNNVLRHEKKELPVIGRFAKWLKA